jgi:serine/threonine protein kinase
LCKFEELNGEYHVRREIGRGSYGVVFKAVKNDENDKDSNGKKK